MATPQSQAPNRLPLNCERVGGKAPGTVIFRFSGPFTARSVFAAQSPDAIGETFDLHAPNGQPASLNVFDLTGVPYMDSAGLGMVMRHYSKCKDNGIRFVAAGASPRVLELFALTKVDTVLSLTATVEEADA